MQALYRKNKEWDVLVVRVGLPKNGKSVSVKKAVLEEIEASCPGKTVDIIQLDAVRSSDEWVEYSVGFMYEA